MDKLKTFTDDEGLIVDRNGDREQSAMLTGLTTGLLILDNEYALADNYYEALKKCCSFFNTWVKHPLSPAEVNQLDVEFISWGLAIWAVVCNSEASRFVMRSLNKRYRPYVHVALQIRMFKLWYLYPLLLICDIDLLVKIALGRESATDDVLLAKDIIIANLKYSTPWSLLAKYFYKKTNFISNIHLYFNRVWVVQTEVGELYKKVCAKYL